MKLGLASCPAICEIFREAGVTDEFLVSVGVPPCAQVRRGVAGGRRICCMRAGVPQ